MDSVSDIPRLRSSFQVLRNKEVDAFIKISTQFKQDWQELVEPADFPFFNSHVRLYFHFCFFFLGGGSKDTF